MDLNQLYSSTLQTSAKLKVIAAHALGWGAKVHHVEAAVGPQAYFYVWDRPTRWSWVCSVPVADELRQIWSNVRATPDDWDSVRGALGDAIHSAAAGTPRTHIPDQPWEVTLGLLLSAYAATTQTLGAMHDLPHGGHFLVMNYRSTAALADGRLRPAGLSGESKTPLSVEHFQNAVAQLVVRDQQQHPDWFR